MAWLSVTLETDCAHAEALADALMEGGPVGLDRGCRRRHG